MSTKVLDNCKQRKITTILVPFVPCSAKLPIIAMFSGYFFKENSGIASASMYFLSIIVIIFSSIILNKFIFKSNDETFISELPDYKIPSIRYVTREVWDKILNFIKRAGTTIFFASLIIWFLMSFSINIKYTTNIENSILSFIGKKISWIFYPMIGVNSWKVTVSALQGIIAKEQVVASMSILSGYGVLTQWSAYSFCVFNLFSAPCFAAIAAMRKELGGFKNMFIAIMYQTVLAWLLATIIYRVFLLIF